VSCRIAWAAGVLVSGGGGDGTERASSIMSGGVQGPLGEYVHKVGSVGPETN